MQKRAKISISIIAIVCTVVFCVVVFALCVLDVKSKHAAELSAGAYEVHTTAEKTEQPFEPEKALSTTERAEAVYSATPAPEKPKTVPTNTKSEAVQITETQTPSLAENIVSNNNLVEPVADTVQEEIIESGLEGEVDYDTSEIDKIFYFYLYNDSTEYEVRAKYKSITEAVIPKTYKGKPVTAICNNGFSLCEDLVFIQLPFGLKRIGACAFLKCEKLQKLYVPETVTFIGSFAFYLCSSLTELILSNNIELSNKIMPPDPRKKQDVE